MTDTPVSKGAQGAGLPGGRQLPPLHAAKVIDSRDAALNMRRVTLELPGDGPFAYRPGQSVVLLLPTGGEEKARRDYTIRSAEGNRLTLDILQHGATTGPEWARAAQPGDLVSFRGPRGGTWLDPEADWHLITGDETCIPAVQHMLETAAPGAVLTVLLEIAGPAFRFQPETRADLRLIWIERGDQPAGPSDLMLDALAAMELPQDGRGRFLLIGETSNVRRQRRLLTDRGIDKAWIYSEGYWRPGRIGGHDHVDD